MQYNMWTILSEVLWGLGLCPSAGDCVGAILATLVLNAFCFSSFVNSPQSRKHLLTASNIFLFKQRQLIWRNRGDVLLWFKLWYTRNVQILRVDRNVEELAISRGFNRELIYSVLCFSVSLISLVSGRVWDIFWMCNSELRHWFLYKSLASIEKFLPRLSSL